MILCDCCKSTLPISTAPVVVGLQSMSARDDAGHVRQVSELHLCGRCAKRLGDAVQAIVRAERKGGTCDDGEFDGQSIQLAGQTIKAAKGGA